MNTHEGSLSVYDLLVVFFLSMLNVSTRLLHRWAGLELDNSPEKELPKRDVEAHRSNLSQQGREALNMILAYGGNIEAVMLAMFDCGLCFSDITKSNRTICQLWQWASTRGQVRTAEKLSNLGVDLEMTITFEDTFDDIPTTALGLASYHLQLDLVDFLLKNGANPNASDPQIPWRTLIHLGSRAARQTKNMHKEDAWLVILSKLISHGADISQIDDEGNSLLSAAARDSHNKKIVSALLERGADPNHLNNDGDSPLSLAVWRYWGRGLYKEESVVSILLQYGADPNIPNRLGQCSLHRCASLLRPAGVMDTLLKGGADPTIRDSRGHTALYYLAGNAGPIDTLKALVDSCDVEDQELQYLWQAALTCSNYDMLLYLLDLGADPNWEHEEHFLIFGLARSLSIKAEGEVYSLLARGA